MEMVNMSRKQQPIEMENVSSRLTIEQAAVVPKTTLYTGTGDYM